MDDTTTPPPGDDTTTPPPGDAPAAPPNLTGPRQYRITYGNGAEEVVGTNHETLELFVNEKFGSAYEPFLEAGGRIELV